jgi:DNA (cytosine-5)-methyltransferase 1
MGNLEKAAFALHEYEGSIKPDHARKGFLNPQRKKSSQVVVPEISYCIAATSGRHTGTDWSRTYVSYFDRVRRLTPNEAEKLQGFPSGWTVPNFINESKDIKDLDTLRYHAIGNAVSVPVVVWIADRIKKIKNEELVNKGFQSVIEKFKDFSIENLRTQYFSSLNSNTLFNDEKNKKIKWNSGGLAFGDKIIDSKVYGCPIDPYYSNLIDIIDEEPIDLKYFLSPSAAIGILRRVNNQNRALFAPLKKSLQRLAASIENKIKV